MANYRHILLSQNVEASKKTGANPPTFIQNVGIISIPNNFKYSIKNFSITQSDSLTIGSGSSFLSYVLYYRFFLSDDPIKTIISQLPSGYNYKYNGGTYTDGNFACQDIKDSSGTIPNELKITNDNASKYSLSLIGDTYYETISPVLTNTVEEVIPFTLGNFSRELRDFYFNSSNNSFLGFAIFPYLAFSTPTNDLTNSFDFTINFDLVTEEV